MHLLIEKWIKVVIFLSAPPLRKVANTSQAKAADKCNLEKSSSKCLKYIKSVSVYYRS